MEHNEKSSIHSAHPLHNSQSIRACESYDPNALLDRVADVMGAKTDRQLAHGLDISAPALSKLRHGKLVVGSALLLRMHDYTGIAVNDLRKTMGIEPVYPPTHGGDRVHRCD